MKNKIQKIMVILLAHFLMYPVYFDGISKSVQQIAVFGSVTIFALFNLNNIRPLYQSLGVHKKTAIISSAFLIFITSASFLIPVIHNTADFSYFSNLLGTVLYLIFYILLIAMIRLFFREEDTKIKLLEIISGIQRNYVLVTILFLLFPNIKLFWVNTIIMTQRSMQLIQDPSYISRVSWDGYAGFTSTVYSTIAVIISIYLIIEYYKNYRSINMKYLFSLFLALIGNTFYGRAGLLVSLLMVAIGVIYLMILYKQYKIFYSIIGSIILLFLFVTLISNFNQTVESWYNWAMEPLISLFETGEIQTSSTNQLWDMWFIPELRTFLIGDGYYNSPLHSGYYMETDVGYLRPVLFFGFFFSSLYYLIPLILGIDFAKNNRESKLLVAMLFLAIFIFEIKGEVVLKFLPIMVMLFIANYVKKPEQILDNQIANNYQLGVKTNELYMD